MALTKTQVALLDIMKKAAIELKENGRCLTSTIGELSACRSQNLIWEPSNGYDAKTRAGERVQIKTRKSWSTDHVNPRGRLGKFGRKAGYEFETGLYIELDQHFEISGIWTMGVKAIKRLESKEAGARALHVSTFKNGAQENPS